MKLIRKHFVAVRMLVLLIILIAAAAPVGVAAQSNMPFNGNVAFHEISVTIPEDFIRASTQSTEDFWVFEKSFYDKYIMLSRKDLDGDADAVLNEYAAYLTQQGVDSRRDTFLMQNAVRSAQTGGEMTWHEVLFEHNGCLYAVAMRGGDEDDLDALLDTVVLYDAAPNIEGQVDERTPLERLMGYLFGE